MPRLILLALLGGIVLVLSLGIPVSADGDVGEGSLVVACTVVVGDICTAAGAAVLGASVSWQGYTVSAGGCAGLAGAGAATGSGSTDYNPFECLDYAGLIPDCTYRVGACVKGLVALETAPGCADASATAHSWHSEIIQGPPAAAHAGGCEEVLELLGELPDYTAVQFHLRDMLKGQLNGWADAGRQGIVNDLGYSRGAVYLRLVDEYESQVASIIDEIVVTPDFVVHVPPQRTVSINIQSA